MSRAQTAGFDEINQVKANFDQIYTQHDPREYYRVLHGLDYIIPDLAQHVFKKIITSLEQDRDRKLTLLDLGCSYGINAALLRYPLDLERLAQRNRDLNMHGLSAEELIALDQSYFASWPRSLDCRIVGLDVATHAVRYALKTGLLDDGIAEDLESHPPSETACSALRDVDLIISTGCVGYVTSRTFEHVLANTDSPPWIASFVLRMFPFEPIAQTLASHRYKTEKLEGVTFVQRRFHSAAEAAETIRLLEEQGIDPSDKEAEGLFHAEFYLSRPEKDCERQPLESIVSVTSGGSRTYGRRFRRIGDDRIRLIK